jgi:hypothetical protein
MSSGRVHTISVSSPAILNEHLHRENLPSDVLAESGRETQRETALERRDGGFCEPPSRRSISGLASEKWRALP